MRLNHLIIRSDERFTFHRIDDQLLYILCKFVLDICREACTTQTDDSRIHHEIDQRCTIRALIIKRFKRTYTLIQSIVFNNKMLHRLQGRMHKLLRTCHSTGNTCKNRNNITFIALGNFCTNGNMVTFLNQYFQIHRRPADQRDKYLAAGFHFHDVYMVAEFLMARNVLTHRSFKQ